MKKIRSFSTFKMTKQMMMFSLFLLLCIAILVIFALVDLQISTKVFDNDIKNKTQVFRDIFNTIGYSAFVLPVFFTLIMIVQKIIVFRNIRSRYIWYWLLVLIIMGSSAVLSIVQWITSTINETEFITMIVFASIYVIIMFLYQMWFWTYKRTDVIYIHNKFIGGIKAFIYLAIIFILISIIKPTFGRNRPFEVLIENKPFYYPFQINWSDFRGNSFPSGHTNSAMTLFAFTLIFANTPGWKKWMVNSFIATIVVLVAISRVLSLAHYTSDVLMSIEMGMVTYLLCNHLFEKRLRNTEF